MPALPHFTSLRSNLMIRGFSPRIRAAANVVDVRAVVAALRFEHLDPAGREMTDIGNHQRRNPNVTVRLDRQANTSDGAANLQIQVNDAALDRIRLHQTEGTTIAQVIVPAAIHRTAFTCHELNVRAHFENVVRSALLSSYDSLGFPFSIAEG